MNELTEAVAGLLEGVVALDREALAHRLGAELGPVRAWFERLGTAAEANESDIAEWSRRAGRPLRVPRIAFPWPPAAARPALLGAAAESPTLAWDDNPRAPGA